jgi:hypothetical protein
VAIRTDCLRPVRTTTTSIEAFTNMLEPVPTAPAELVDA